MKYFFLLFFFISILINAPVFGQKATINQPVDALQKKSRQKPPRKKIKPVFSLQMDRAAGDFSWCETYFKSFKKTKEIDYLKLAGKHCSGAIRIYLQTQKDQSGKTPFHYQAKAAKLKVCSFYKSMRTYSLQRRKSEQLPKFNSSYCENR